MEKIIPLILLMALVTALPRLLPMWFLAGRSFSPALQSWLRYVPVAVIAAMLGPELFLKGGQLFLSTENLYLCAAIPTLLIGVWKKNLAYTVLTGMATLALLRFIVH